jgi:hypothetical protein
MESLLDWMTAITQDEKVKELLVEFLEFAESQQRVESKE